MLRLNAWIFVTLLVGLVLGPACTSTELTEAPPALTATEDCSNRLDDDGDGKVDCIDPDCFDSPACGGRPQGLTPIEICDNSTDDDGDGKIDCLDEDCTKEPRCNAFGGNETCDNGVDDDGDTFVDCADPDCAAKGGCSENNDIACSNNLDDDGDGKIDCLDDGCEGKACGAGCVCQDGAKRERICGDGVDNDGDGVDDCADPDCATDPICANTENCSDGIDNDGDRKVDCVDPSCVTSAACRALPDGAACSSNGQCAGGRCFTETTGNPNGFCSNTTSCTLGTNAGCNGGLCVPQTANYNQCLPRCTGNGVQAPNACRVGYVCIDSDRLTNTATPVANNNVCVAFCTRDQDCAGEGEGYGCNIASGFCGKKSNGRKPYGAACAASSECEGAVCDLSRPGGYCLGFCSGSTQACASGGVCAYNSSTGDNVGFCLDGCANNAECRGAPYACSAFGQMQVCMCQRRGEVCDATHPCCTGTCNAAGRCE